MSNLNEYHKIIEEIWHHNKLYYVDHAPEISDEAFDFLLKKLEAIEKAHPEWVTSISPSQRVMESLTEGFKTVAHTIPMLSLQNTYSREEVELFLKRVVKLTGSENHSYSVELKMDGIAISIRYEKGKLVQGVTRGDGQKGDDVTMNIRTIKGLPLQLVSSNPPELLEVRGEVYMPHVEFERLNRLKQESQEILWANPRNAAAGSLKMLDPKEVAKRGLACVFYGIAELKGDTLKTQFETHAYLKKLGLPTLKQAALASNADQIFQFADQVLKNRSTFGFDIDGIVIKLNDLKEQQHLGSAGKHPRFAVAYKFAAEQAETKVLDITVQVGRTGVLTPVAELAPVFLQGSTIARATLHNQEEVERKDIRIGDSVIIEKGGDVIPKVVSVNLFLRPQDAVQWHMPKVCPSCNTPVVKSEGEVAYRCPNPTCHEQLLRRVIYFAGKDAFDIENLGEKVAEMLFRKGLVRTPSDLFALTEEQIATLDHFKEKSVKNLFRSIQASKQVTLDRFIMALGIKHIGQQTAELLAIKAHSIQKLMEMTKEEFMKIEGIGEKVANALLEFFSDSANRLEIDRLLKMGVTPASLRAIEFVDHFFGGKTFVLTGTLDQFSRQEAAKLIKERGGKVTDTVSKKTDFVVAGSDPGSKYEKAKALGIPLLDEASFLQHLNLELK